MLRRIVAAGVLLLSVLAVGAVGAASDVTHASHAKNTVVADTGWPIEEIGHQTPTNT